MELAIQVRKDFDYIVGSALWAEDNGLTALALPDHYMQRGSDPELPGYDHIVHLAGLARETTNLELVCLVAPVTFRHPAVLYKMGVTIDEMSGGRFTLGVGAGWLEEEFTMFGLPYPERAERFELLEETMGYLRAAITPGTHGFAGTHYQLAEFDPHPHPHNLRLLIGGGGKVKTPRIAGRYADEFNIYACLPELYKEKSDTARRHATEAGRDPKSILFTAASPALAAKKESDYRNLLTEFAELTGQSTEHIEETYTERGYPHGSGSRPAEMLSALEEAGCQRFYAQAFAADIEMYETIFDAYRG
ncbi:TIGR03560 family F420-dependent LLM class oxidoreductase [soil metagenome]